MFEITRKYIENGSIEDASSCPIALCVKDHFKEYTDKDQDKLNQIKVTRGHLLCPFPLTEYARDRNINSYPFSDELRLWVMDFDYDNQVPEIMISVDRDKCSIQNN